MKDYKFPDVQKGLKLNSSPCDICTNFWCLSFNCKSHKIETCGKYRKWKRERSEASQKVIDDWNAEVFGDVLRKKGEKK